MPLVLGLIGLASAAVPYAGLEWRPLSRADLVWVDEDRTSGFGVGEFDGTARPSMQAYGGAWLSRRVALGGALGIARLQNTSEVDDIVAQRQWGVVRPSLDLRVALLPRLEHRALPYAIVGGHADIPSARDVSTGYTEDEQASADESASVERARLAGFGARVGLGAEYALMPGLSLGAMWTVEGHRGLFRTDDLSVVSQWIAAEAALLLVFEWPRRGSDVAGGKRSSSGVVAGAPDAP